MIPQDADPTALLRWIRAKAKTSGAHSCLPSSRRTRRPKPVRRRLGGTAATEIPGLRPQLDTAIVAGLLACRELDDALGLTETADECLQESRGGRNVQHRLVGLFRQSVYSRLAGYEGTNDAERLSDDPTMRVVVERRGSPERPAASTNTMSRFETEVLTQDGNVEGLGRVNAKWVDRAMTHTPHRRVILDMDSSESPVHGGQEGASCNGHFGSSCHHSLFVFNQFGDCEGAMLRAGNVHSAHRCRDVLDPILSRYEEMGLRRYFRADAAFAKPDIYEYQRFPGEFAEWCGREPVEPFFG